MRTKILRWMLSLAAGMAFGSAAWAVASSTQGPTFKIGDPAPAIEPKAWIQGSPVTKYEPGRVYVVEFWATWCPPCVASIPHLSELQKKYADKLTIVGVNVDSLGEKMELDAVRAFVKQKGEKMTYT